MNSKYFLMGMLTSLLIMAIIIGIKLIIDHHDKKKHRYGKLATIKFDANTLMNQRVSRSASSKRLLHPTEKF